MACSLSFAPGNASVQQILSQWHTGCFATYRTLQHAHPVLRLFVPDSESTFPRSASCLTRMDSVWPGLPQVSPTLILES